MKLLIVLSVLATGYAYMLLQTTDLVLNQTQKINATYQYAADHPDQLATGQKN